MIVRKYFYTKDINGDLWETDLPPFIIDDKIIFECCFEYRKCPENWSKMNLFKDMKVNETRTIKVKIDENI